MVSTYKIFTFLFLLLLIPTTLFAGPGMDLFEALLNKDAGEVNQILRYNPELIDIVSHQVFQESHGDFHYSSQGQTPLSFCIQYHLDSMTSLLLQQGASPDVSRGDGWTPLLLASRQGHLWAVKQLLQRGAQREQSLSDGQSPLSLTMENAHFEVADLLVQQGSRLYGTMELTDSLAEQIYRRKIALREALVLVDTGLDSHVLLNAAQHGDSDLVTILIAQGMAPDSRDSQGITPLMAAVQNGHINTARVLLNLGASPNGSDVQEIRPLLLAAAQGDIPMMQLLFDGGADLDRGESLEFTALYHAVIFQQSQALNWLLQQGAALNRRDQQGRTALMIAVYLGNRALVEPLIEKGAVVVWTDFQGESAIYYGLWAYERNLGVDYYGIIDLLIDRGLDSRRYAPMAINPRYLELLEARYR